MVLNETALCPGEIAREFTEARGTEAREEKSDRVCHWLYCNADKRKRARPLLSILQRRCSFVFPWSAASRSCFLPEGTLKADTPRAPRTEYDTTSKPQQQSASRWPGVGTEETRLRPGQEHPPHPRGQQSRSPNSNSSCSHPFRTVKSK